MEEPFNSATPHVHTACLVGVQPAGCAMMSGSAVVQRVGVMGGAFDPPHLAHIALAQAAMTQLQLDWLHIVPTGLAWHKQRVLTAAAHRIAMVQLAFEFIPQAVVDVRETLRSGPSYTIDTLREMQAALPHAELFLIMGADQAHALHTWKSWQNIVQIAIVCIASRAYSMGISGIFGTLDAQKMDPSRFRQITLPGMKISATDIRAQLAAQHDVTALVSEPVVRYIADHHLYQTL